MRSQACQGCKNISTNLEKSFWKLLETMGDSVSSSETSQYGAMLLSWCLGHTTLSEKPCILCVVTEGQSTGQLSSLLRASSEEAMKVFKDW